LIAIAILGLGIAIYLTRSGPLDSTAMAAYFPKREATVAYLDIAAVRNSGLLDKLVGSRVAEEADYRRFVEQTGFDYKRDLDRAMVNSAGGIHYFLLQGRFDWAKLRSYVQQNGGSCRGDECTIQGSTPERIISFRPLRDDLMAMATARDDAGSRAIDRRTPTPAAFSVPNEPVWLHVPAEAIRSARELPPGTKTFAKALQPAERVIFTLGPAQNQFHLKMDVICRTQEDAAVLKAQLEGLTSLLQSFLSRERQKPNQADLSGVLTSGTFNRSGRHVIGTWTVQQSFLESLGGD
jgi:hypothetical protein